MLQTQAYLKVRLDEKTFNKTLTEMKPFWVLVMKRRDTPCIPIITHSGIIMFWMKIFQNDGRLPTIDFYKKTFWDILSITFFIFRIGNPVLQSPPVQLVP